MPAEGAVLLLVDLLEQHALIELGRLFEIGQELLLRDVQEPELQPRAGLGVHHEIVQPAPRRLELLVLGMMQDPVELIGDPLIDLRDAGLDGRHDIVVHRHAFVERLRGELANQIAGMHHLRFVAGHAAFGQNPFGRDGLRRRLGSIGLWRIRAHRAPPSPRAALTFLRPSASRPTRVSRSSSFSLPSSFASRSDKRCRIS